MKNYTVTLWRHPSEDREPNAVGVSVFYFKETADTKEKAIAQAKEKFQHDVWESAVIEEPSLFGELRVEKSIGRGLFQIVEEQFHADCDRNLFDIKYSERPTEFDLSVVEAKDLANKIVKSMNMHDKLTDALQMICNYASQKKLDMNVLKQMAEQGSELLKQAEKK